MLNTELRITPIYVGSYVMSGESYDINAVLYLSCNRCCFPVYETKNKSDKSIKSI